MIRRFCFFVSLLYLFPVSHQAKSPGATSRNAEGFVVDPAHHPMTIVEREPTEPGGEPVLVIVYASDSPSSTPTDSQAPTSSPTVLPTSLPSELPTSSPTETPSSRPSLSPTVSPSQSPTRNPSETPSILPSKTPSFSPSVQPTSAPSLSPTSRPSFRPSLNPSTSPSLVPSVLPSTYPSLIPSTLPSSGPSLRPSSSPTETPSGRPSQSPSSTPSESPSASPSQSPSASPSARPTNRPSQQPSSQPSGIPSSWPSSSPSDSPSARPSSSPSSVPTLSPSSTPSSAPSVQPSLQPSSLPSSSPSTLPTSSPSGMPTGEFRFEETMQAMELDGIAGTLSEDEVKVFEATCANDFLAQYVPSVTNEDFRDFTCAVINQSFTSSRRRGRVLQETGSLALLLNITAFVPVSNSVSFSGAVTFVFRQYNRELKQLLAGNSPSFSGIQGDSNDTSTDSFGDSGGTPIVIIIVAAAAGLALAMLASVFLFSRARPAREFQSSQVTHRMREHEDDEDSCNERCSIPSKINVDNLGELESELSPGTFRGRADTFSSLHEDIPTDQPINETGGTKKRERELESNYLETEEVMHTKRERSFNSREQSLDRKMRKLTLGFRERSDGSHDIEAVESLSLSKKGWSYNSRENSLDQKMKKFALGFRERSDGSHDVEAMNVSDASSTLDGLEIGEETPLEVKINETPMAFSLPPKSPRKRSFNSMRTRLPQRKSGRMIVLPSTDDSEFSIDFGRAAGTPKSNSKFHSPGTTGLEVCGVGSPMGNFTSKRFNPNGGKFLQMNLDSVTHTGTVLNDLDALESEWNKKFVISATSSVETPQFENTTKFYKARIKQLNAMK